MSIRDILKVSFLAAPFGLAACSDGKGGVDPLKTGALFGVTAVAAGIIASEDKVQNRNGDRGWDRPRRGHYLGDGHDHSNKWEREWRKAERREERAERRERRERRGGNGQVCTLDGGQTFYRC